MENIRMSGQNTEITSPVCILVGHAQKSSMNSNHRMYINQVKYVMGDRNFIRPCQGSGTNG